VAYSRQVYRALVNTSEQLEEALANADSYLRLTQNHYTKAIGPIVRTATRDYLRNSFPFEPPGYREARHRLTSATFQDGQNELLCRVRAAQLHHGRNPADWNLATGMTRGMFKVTDAISVIVPRGAQVKMPIKHLLPVATCRPKEMIRLYESVGYTWRTGKGRHIVLSAPDRLSMTLPGGRDELSVGVAKNALRVLGNYSIAELPKLLREGLR
jgi:predicted RNA binding protein YcfA (HicA-like mRNA interferase family)